jgi:hypothetical protein
VAEQRLGVLDPGVPRDVVAVGVAHQVGVDVRGDPGAARGLVNEALQRLAAHRAMRVGAPVRVAAEAAAAGLRAGQDVIVGPTLSSDLGDDRCEVAE